MEQKRAKLLKRMVARDGVEPPTPAFSGLRSRATTCLNQKHLSPIFPPKLTI